MDNSNKFLSDLVAYRSYAKYIEPKNRRESLEETINRNLVMHLDRFGSMSKKLSKDIINAYELVHELKIVPSLRTLQFSGDAILQNSTRSYNCSFMNIDNSRCFGELLFLLLSGVGVGYSVQQMHISKLPTIQKPKEEGIFVIHDSIEGWAQACQMLFDAYFFKGIKPIFDFSKIRARGVQLSTTGSKAPGPEPLNHMLKVVETKLKKAIGRKLQSLEVHDICCIISDCVIAGGHRRSALICLFDKDDNSMLTAKHGDWWVKNPWRARANNSASLLREDTSKEDFRQIFNLCRESNAGEPGFMWTNRYGWGVNPCQPGFANVLTPEGIKTFDDIDIGSIIWGGNSWTKVVNKWSTGIKPVYKYTTTMSQFIGTENHRVVSNGEKIEVGLADSIDRNTYILEDNMNCETNPQDIMDGLVVGDGSVYSNIAYLHIGEKDNDYFNSEVSDLILNNICASSSGGYNVKTTINFRELPKTYDRTIPDRFFYGSFSKKLGFLRGLFSANGSVITSANHISLKQTSEKLIRQVQVMLSSIGIGSYITTNKESFVKHKNGIYKSKQSYDLSITTDRHIFAKLIGFIQKYKEVKNTLCAKPRINSNICNVEYLGEHEVFDITVDNDTHTYWTDGSLVSNCAEISLQSTQFCNLTSCNQTSVENKQDFMNRVKAATIIGTLQAAYTDFPYLREEWKNVTENAALLGVSFTGISDSVNKIKDEWLVEGAELAKQINDKYARIIGINSAHRITTVKPEGSSSCLMGSSSGIHPRFSDYYIRRIRINKDDILAKYLMHTCPDLVEDDLSSPNTIVLSIGQKSPDGCITRNQESALQLLDRAMKYNNLWVANGHREGVNRNNVSLTVYVKEDEWDNVFEYLWLHRNEYSGVSLLPFDNGTYKQTPFEECTKEHFDMLNSKVAKINLREIIEDADYTNRSETVACGGGSCEII